MLLQGLLLPWAHTCPLISFLVMVFSFRTGPTAAAVKLQLQLWLSFWMLLRTSLFLCWNYLFIQIIWCISTGLGLIVSSSIRSATLTPCTSSALLILYHWHQWSKWSLSAHRQRNSSPKWCCKPAGSSLTHSDTFLSLCKHRDWKYKFIFRGLIFSTVVDLN